MLDLIVRRCLDLWHRAAMGEERPAARAARRQDWCGGGRAFGGAIGKDGRRKIVRWTRGIEAHSETELEIQRPWSERPLGRYSPRPWPDEPPEVWHRWWWAQVAPVWKNGDFVTEGWIRYATEAYRGRPDVVQRAEEEAEAWPLAQASPLSLLQASPFKGEEVEACSRARAGNERGRRWNGIAGHVG